MGGLSGADLDGMTALVADIDNARTQLDTLANTIRGGVSQSSAYWGGLDAEEFRQLWANTHDPALRRAATQLQELAEIVRVNRDDQATTSASLDGPGRTGAPIGGPGVVAGRGVAGGSAAGGSAAGGSGPGAGGTGAGGGGSGPGGLGPGSPGDEFSSGAFAYDDMKKGTRVQPYTNDVALGTAVAGDYAYRQNADGSVLATANFDLRSGLQVQTGTENRDGTVQYGAQAGGFSGVRANAKADVEISSDRFKVDAEAAGFVGVEAEAKGDVAVGPVFIAAQGTAMAGAGAEGAVRSEFDGRTARAKVKAEAFYGAKAGAEGDVGMLDNTVSIGGGIGVSTGIGAGASGEVALGLDEIGYEGSIGLTLGVGGEVSVDLSFSPSGLYKHISNNPFDTDGWSGFGGATIW